MSRSSGPTMLAMAWILSAFGWKFTSAPKGATKCKSTYRSAEAQRHPKSNTQASFFATYVTAIAGEFGILREYLGSPRFFPLFVALGSKSTSFFTTPLALPEPELV
jgi:hypothetical protein